MIASGSLVVPNNILAGKRIDGGASKEAFLVKGDDSRIVLLSKNSNLDELTKEVELLRQIEKAGGPIVRIDGIVDVGGRPGILKQNITDGITVKPFFFNDEIERAIPRLGQSSLDDLTSIRNVIGNSEIGDFQLLVSQKGRVFIDDPTSFGPLPGGQRYNIELVDELIRSARKNTGQ